MLEAVDFNGESLWAAELDSACAAMVLFRDGILCILEDGTAAAVDYSGEGLWKRMGGGFRGYPAVAVDGIYLVYDRAGIAELEFDGRLKAQTSVADVRLTQPVLAGGLLTAGTAEWIVYAFGAAMPDNRVWGQPGGNAHHSGTVYLPGSGFDESIYLSSMDYVYLKSMIDSVDIDRKREALDEIAERMSGDSPQRGDSYLLHLLHRSLAEGALRFDAAGGMDSISSYPPVRSRAAYLAGRLGNLETVDILLSMLQEEDDPLVAASIISALGRLGSDYGGAVQEAVYRRLKRGYNGMPDDRIAMAAAEAAERFYDYNGGAASGYSYRILTEILRSGYSNAARKRAKEVLRSIR